MRKKAAFVSAAAIAMLVAARVAAQAGAGDVKSGVDAWQSGDYAHAVAAWAAPAAAGDPDAEFNLGQAYKYGRGVPQDYGQAIQLYGQAAAHGHKQAEANLGLLLFQTGDHANAIPHLEHAASAGDPRAQYYLGTACFNGDGVSVDQVKAYALMTRAAASGLPPAQASLQQMDGYLSQPVRQKGTLLARRMAATQPHALTPAVQTAGLAGAPAAGSPAPLHSQPPIPQQPIATASLPPSVTAAHRPTSAPMVQGPIAATATIAVPAHAPSGAGGWRVQLGAYGDAEKAEQLWASLSHKYAGLTSSQHFLVHAGAVTRLQAGPFASASAANAVCTQTKAGGQDCIPVKP